MIGAGSMANQVHYPSLNSFSDVEIAGICELNTERLHKTADKYEVEGRYPVQGLEEYRKVVEQVTPNAIYAIGNPDQMYPVWIWCLEQGIPLYIEKPMGLTLHQARALAHLAEKHHCITQVSFQRRSCPMVVQLRNACLERGAIQHAVCEFYKCLPEPFLGARDHMMDDGVHAIDTLRWICGSEVRRIYSKTRAIGTPDLNFFSVMLEFQNGAVGILLNSWTSGRRIFRVQMHAPTICAEAEHEGRGVLYADGDTLGTWFDTREVAGSDQLYVYGGYQAKNREFIDAVLEKNLPSSHFGDAYYTMETAEKVLAQSLLSES
jgi:predicted dehydrogenase